MFPTRLTPRCTMWLIGLSALALLAPLALPHGHDHASVSRPESSCRVCRIEEGFAATPAAPAIGVVGPLMVAARLLLLSELPRVVVVLRRFSPRAPPAFS